jgi:hypothetical protein
VPPSLSALGTCHNHKALEEELMNKSVHMLSLGTLAEASSGTEILLLKKFVDFAMLLNCMYVAVSRGY